MRVDVIGKHMEVTEPIRTFAESKSERLTRHYDGVQRIVFRLEQEPHNKGFHVEVVVDVEKHDDFVANATGPDLYTCIDQAVDKSVRQLTTFKEKLKQSK
ncbi:MAG: ribosome hibernation-promoting factor, HPF/YfiA family [bacterium]|jgi:putative sigma-54 modulation protein|nr:ribosome-associated translation inhibitor RaiA [Phycisphaerales bacterium]MCE2652420.1 ribosome-associated translation inhibitor RaiA [Planctomycetaceae bacterium]